MADRIYLTGNFNDWNQRELPMYQERDGAWRIALDFPQGQQFEFRYLVDGQWRTDYHADGCLTNPFGSENSLVQAEILDDGGETIAPPSTHISASDDLPVRPLDTHPAPSLKITSVRSSGRALFGQTSRPRLDDVG
ncbi:MAG: hypothetical protein HC802_15650 [Caldilineaceae bacterium]|nr:hypothetical protein [Caldilineaceae bacterium]